MCAACRLLFRGAQPDALAQEERDVGGTTRLRFEGGWTSLQTKSGKKLLEKVEVD
jgi:hypothetical protein